MSVGGIFSLLSTDTSTDKLFTAYELLDIRLNKIKESNVQPSLKFIEHSHIIYTKSQYTPFVGIASEYFSLGSTKFDITNTVGNNLTFYIKTLSADFLNDCVLHITINPVGNKAAYEANSTPTAELPLYRYCAYPGIRLIENATFNSSSLMIDSYTPDDILFYKNFFIKNDHKPGWNRCFGQDEIQQATYNSKSFTGILNYSNGFQTPKLYHDKFHMFIPLHFWFCEDVSNALIIRKLGNTQRNFNFKLTSLDKIIQALIYNVTEGQPPNITQVGTEIVPLPISKLSANATLYGNMLYTYPVIMNIINSEVNFSLIRVHKQQLGSLTSGINMIELRQSLTFPGEFLMVGFRNKDNSKDFDRWHLMGSDYLTEDTNRTKILHVPAIIWNTEFQIRQLVVREAVQATSMNAVMDTISLTVSGGITVYPTLQTNFYNDYLPIRYTKNSLVVSPLDNNMFLITFSLYPGKFNPSGHFNFSNNKLLLF